MSSSSQLADMQARLVARSSKMKGYLEKKSGNMFVGFQSRYFLVMEQFLAYFKDESLTEPRGKIDFRLVKSINKEGSRDITLETDERTYVFRAVDEATRDDWVGCLNVLREYHQMGG